MVDNKMVFPFAEALTAKQDELTCFCTVQTHLPGLFRTTQ